jgi:hypothetical protein
MQITALKNYRLLEEKRWLSHLFYSMPEHARMLFLIKEISIFGR